MPVDRKTQRVIDAYQHRTTSLRDQLVRCLTAAWGALPDYRTDNIAGFVASVVPTVEGSLAVMGSLTDAYLAAVETTQTGERTAPVGVGKLTTEDLRGTPAVEVYQRGGTTVWTALGDGVEFPQAWQQGLDRLLNIATTDLQLAKTHTFREILSGKKHVGGYRRVLEGAHSCGMCVVASTQRYHKGELLPIHGGCDCAVLPIYGTDPGRIIDSGTLDDVHDRIAERFGSDVVDQTRTGPGDLPRYQDLIVVHHHGELGPVLTRKGDAFTGPSAVL